MKRRVVFIHTQVGERDGVSLEIEKRAKILSELGHEVSFIAGVDGYKRKNTYLIDNLHDSSLTKTIRRNLFFERTVKKKRVLQLLTKAEEKIAEEFDKAIRKLLPDVIFVHNLFSLPINLPASIALMRSLDKYRIPTVAIHHDFWFERKKFLKPRLTLIKNLLDLLPPKRDYILAHQVLNSIAQKDLYRRTGIMADKIGDYFDYHQPTPIINTSNQNLRKDFKIKDEDLVILQSSRIMPRKGIENTVLFSSALQKKIEKTGKKVFVLFSNLVGADSLNYFHKLEKLAKALKVNALWAEDKFSLERKSIAGEKIYSFWDSYVHADLVTYPSFWEGFGNQFLEAIYFKKPVVLFEYPVFRKDLKKEGYQYISLGHKTIKKNGFNFVEEEVVLRAVTQTLDLLKDKRKREKMVNENFQIAKKYHDISFLKGDIKKIIAHLIEHPPPTKN